MKVAGVTFVEGTAYGLGEEIAYGLGEISCGAEWIWRLAANLAMAALLGRAGDNRVIGNTLVRYPVNLCYLDGI